LRAGSRRQRIFAERSSVSQRLTDRMGTPMIALELSRKMEQVVLAGIITHLRLIFLSLQE
jgi:hypothetical protein